MIFWRSGFFKKINHPIFYTGLVFVFFTVVIVLSLLKSYIKKPTYIYSQIKIGQGLWWASTNRPNIWFIKGLKKGDKEYNYQGKVIAEVQSIKYYPIMNNNQYEIYVTVKLSVNINSNHQYVFKRSPIGVGSPIDLDIKNSQFSGTITDLSDKPITDQSIEKIIYLTKKNPYSWEYSGITINDYYHDGQNQVFTVIDKWLIEDNQSQSYIEFSDNIFKDESNVDVITTTNKVLIVKAKIKATKINDQLIYGEYQVLNIGNILGVTTSKFYFKNYYISKIE